MIDYDSNELVYHVVVDDDIAERMYGIPRKTQACLRGWVMTNRETRLSWAAYRFLRPDDSKSWVRSEAKARISPDVLRDAMMNSFKVLCGVLGLDPVKSVACFTCPPGLSGKHTIDWLVGKNLVDVNVADEFDASDGGVAV